MARRGRFTQQSAGPTWRAWVVLLATVQVLAGRSTPSHPGLIPSSARPVVSDAGVGAQGLGRALLAATCDRSFDADLAASRRLRQGTDAHQ